MVVLEVVVLEVVVLEVEGSGTEDDVVVGPVRSDSAGTRNRVTGRSAAVSTISTGVPNATLEAMSTMCSLSIRTQP